jgi:hypothetical protein
MLDGVIAEELLIPSASVLSLWSDPDSFPSAVVSVPGYLLFEGQFDQDDVIYSPFISDGHAGIYPNLLIDSDRTYVFSTSFSAAIVAPLFRDTDVVYAPVVNNKVLGPSLFIDQDAFGGLKKLQQGAGTINQQFPIDKVFDVDIIYGAVVEHSGIVIVTQQAILAVADDVIFLSETTASTIQTSGSFVRETASYTAPPLGQVVPQLVIEADVFPSPNVLGPIIPSFFQDVDVLYPPARLNSLLPSAILDADVFFTTASARQLLPNIITDQDVINGPTLTRPGTMGLVSDAAESIPAPTVTPQRATLLPPLFNDVDVFYVPRTDAAIIAPVLSDDSTFYVPAASIGPLTPVVSVVDPEPIYVPVIGDAPHVPSLVVDTDAVFAPSVGITQTLTAGIPTDVDSFNTPALAAAAGFDGTLALDGPIMPATPQPTVIYIEG